MRIRAAFSLGPCVNSRGATWRRVQTRRRALALRLGSGGQPDVPGLAPGAPLPPVLRAWAAGLKGATPGGPRACGAELDPGPRAV